jgi:hypothetical protein
MKTAAEYRAMADECFKWAREAQTKEVRKSYLQLAQIQTKQLETRLRQVKASLTLVFAWGARLIENGLGAR